MVRKLILPGVFCAILLSVLFTSCVPGKQNKTIDLPATPVLGGETGWAVILMPYVTFKDTPGPTGIITAHGRKGDVLEIIGRRILKNGAVEETWVRFDDGWLPEDAVRTFPDRYKAEYASRDLQ